MLALAGESVLLWKVRPLCRNPGVSDRLADALGFSRRAMGCPGSTSHRLPARRLGRQRQDPQRTRQE